MPAGSCMLEDLPEPKGGGGLLTLYTFFFNYSDGFSFVQLRFCAQLCAPAIFHQNSIIESRINELKARDEGSRFHHFSLNGDALEKNDR